MFQNISEEYIKQNTVAREKKNKKINIFSNVFSLQYVFLYIVSFMIPMVGIDGQVSPFSISMMSACMGNSIPILGIIITGCIGNAISFGIEGVLTYLLISLVLVTIIFLIKPI